MPRIYLPPKKEYKTKRVYKTLSNRENINRFAVYNTTIWRALRIEKLKADPLCEECLKNEKITSGVDVHHIVPISTGTTIREKQSLGFDFKNLKTLCKQCHKDAHI